MPEINSPHNQRFKNAAKLRRTRERSKQGRFIIDGLREIRRATESDVVIDELFLCRAQVEEAVASELEGRVGSERVFVVPDNLFEKLAFGQRHEGLVATAIREPRPLDALNLPAQPFVGVVEQIEKPGNLGAILRTADAVGLDALIISQAVVDLYNPNTIRASLGAVFSVPVAEASQAETIAFLDNRQIRTFAAVVDADSVYTELDFRGSVAIVLGSETHGLSDVWKADNVTPLAIPMCGKVDSLNVSTSAAILFYEALRQRSGRTGP